MKYRRSLEANSNGRSDAAPGRALEGRKHAAGDFVSGRKKGESVAELLGDVIVRTDH